MEAMYHAQGNFEFQRKKIVYTLRLQACKACEMWGEKLEENIEN